MSKIFVTPSPSPTIDMELYMREEGCVIILTKIDPFTSWWVSEIKVKRNFDPHRYVGSRPVTIHSSPSHALKTKYWNFPSSHEAKKRKEKKKGGRKKTRKKREVGEGGRE